MTEDEIVESTLGHSEGQGSLACCSAWGCKDSDATQQLAPAATHPRALHSAAPSAQKAPPATSCPPLLTACCCQL